MWSGALADEMGLSGDVDADVLSAALDGTLPNGEVMPKLHGNRRIGEDLTFSAPKSVSIAALAWGDDRLIEAHDEAVQETLEWIAQNMIYARHGKGGMEREYNPKVMFASHRHIDSRPVTLPSGEVFVAPQLHSHVVAPNICRRADGSLGGIQIDMGEASGIRLYADALYQAALARRIRDRGIALREGKEGFEITSIDDQMIAEWSPRKQQIDQQLASQGLSRETSSNAQRQAANLKTRSAKDTTLTPAQLRQSWAEKAAQSPTPRNYYPMQPVATDYAAKTAKNAIDDLAERQAVIPQALLWAKVLSAGCAHATAQDMGAVLPETESLIELQDGHYTTTRAVQDESYIRAATESGTPMPALVAPEHIDQWLTWREQQQGFAYSPDQRRALDYLAQTPDRIALAVGSAGAGKTTAMTAIAQIASQEYEVIGLTPSHAAADALRSAIPGTVQTVAKWINKPPAASKKPRYIILDEAGMVGTSDMAAVLRTLAPHDRLLLVGDPRQLGPVAAGQPYADLLQTRPHATVTQIRRQEDEDQRDMVADFARGDAKAGVEKLMKYVIETDDYADTLQKAAAAYVAANGSVIALASRRQTVTDLSHAIRAAMQDAGRISADVAQIATYDKVATTKAAMQRAATYKKGTRLKKPNGKIVTVTEPLTDQTMQVTDDAGKRHNLAWDDDWQIVTDETLTLAIGDELMVTDTIKAQTTAGEKITLKNGQALTVQNVDGQQITAQLPDGQVILMDAERPLPLSYGWAKTVHKSQAQSVDDTILVDDDITGAKLGYVGASRQRKSIKVFSSDPEGLAERLSEWATKASALDHAPTDAAAQRYAAAKAAGESEAQAPAQRLALEESERLQREPVQVSTRRSI